VNVKWLNRLLFGLSGMKIVTRIMILVNVLALCATIGLVFANRYRYEHSMLRAPYSPPVIAEEKCCQEGHRSKLPMMNAAYRHSLQDTKNMYCIASISITILLILSLINIMMCVCIRMQNR